MLRLLVVFALLLPVRAFAGDTTFAGDKWTNKSAGYFEYVEDIGDTAIFSWRITEDADRPAGYLNLPGLAGGDVGAHGTHKGYYIFNREGACPAKMTGPNGVSSTYWGTAMIVFHDPPPPTAWTLFVGVCFDDPSQASVGLPEIDE